MLAKPFQNKENLIFIYTAFSFLFALISTIMQNYEWIREYPSYAYIINAYAWAVTVGYLIIIVYSTTFACFKLSEPGISSEIKRLVLLRHIMTMLTWLLVNTYPLSGFVISTMPKWDGKLPNYDGPLSRILKVLCEGQGLLLSF